MDDWKQYPLGGTGAGYATNKFKIVFQKDNLTISGSGSGGLMDVEPGLIPDYVVAIEGLAVTNVPKTLAVSRYLPVWIPVACPDFDKPKVKPGFWDALANDILKLGKKEPVHFHFMCQGGKGRTGMFLSIVMGKLLGMDGRTSIEYVRKAYYETAVETAGQGEYIRQLLGGPEVKDLFVTITKAAGTWHAGQQGFGYGGGYEVLARIPLGESGLPYSGFMEYSYEEFAKTTRIRFKMPELTDQELMEAYTHSYLTRQNGSVGLMVKGQLKLMFIGDAFSAEVVEWRNLTAKDENDLDGIDEIVYYALSRCRNAGVTDADVTEAYEQDYIKFQDGKVTCASGTRHILALIDEYYDMVAPRSTEDV